MRRVSLETGKSIEEKITAASPSIVQSSLPSSEGKLSQMEMRDNQSEEKKQLQELLHLGTFMDMDK